MYASTFIFAKGRFDEAFHRLDQEIAVIAKSIPGYLISQVLGTYGDSKIGQLLPAARSA